MNQATGFAKLSEVAVVKPLEVRSPWKISRVIPATAKKKTKAVTLFRGATEVSEATL